MARRRRLDPAEAGGAGTPIPAGGLETKAYPNGWAGVSRPPVAEVAGDAAAHAALEAVTDELATARSSGRLICRLPLETVDDAYLVRDRIALDPEDQAALMEYFQGINMETFA